MSLHSIRYKAYGTRAYATEMENMISTPDDAPMVSTPVPVVEKSVPTPHLPPKPYQPKLPAGCKADPGHGNFRYTKNGKTTTGSTCEIAKLNWELKYGRHDDDHDDHDHHNPGPFPPVIGVPHRHVEYIFWGLVRCKNSKKKGCWRAVKGRTPEEARKNFCKLYGPCRGDPRVVVQIPVSFIADSNPIYVYKIIDKEVPGGLDEDDDQAQAQTQTQSVTVNAAPTPPVDDKAAPAGPGAAGPDVSDFLSGSVAGIPTVLLIGGAFMFMMMMMMMKK